jgi:hypothetical protein
MSVLLAVFKVLLASSPSTNSLLPNYATGINNGAAFYVVKISSQHILDPGVGIRAISRRMQPSADWNRAITTLLTCTSLMVPDGTRGG